MKPRILCLALTEGHSKIPSTEMIEEPSLKMNDTHASSVSLHERCQYPNKQCPNRRMAKRNGQLHRLCVEHREIANRYQRRWLESRVQQDIAKRCPPVPAAQDNTLPTAVDDSLDSTLAPPGGDSSMDEFEKMLFDAGELSELLKDLLLTPEELRALHEDATKECHFLSS